jgi:hypothetical protein
MFQKISRGNKKVRSALEENQDLAEEKSPAILKRRY